MGLGKECEDKESSGLKGMVKRLFGLGGGGECCDVKIVQIEEDEEQKETTKEAD